ncbi:MAG: hypothetical protein SFW62_00255 [Alphaproteobacteria bacterium]|nr:hypothetical protein [Alphaproteobacteria bacterium]
MARYIIFTLGTSQEIREALRNHEDAGLMLQDAITRVLYENGRHIPSKENPPPQPVALNIGDTKVGHVIGHYYDDQVPGIQLHEIPVAPHSIAFTMNTAYVDEFASMPAELIGSRILRLMDGFRNNPEKNFSSLQTNPVFYNDTDEPFPLCIIKSNPFRQHEAGLLLKGADQSYWNVPPHYDSPRRPLQAVASPSKKLKS